MTTTTITPTHPRRRSFWRAGLALAALAFSACSSGGGTAAPARPLGNLKVTAVRLASGDPNAAHEMTLATSIEATAEFREVAVAYVLLNKADVDGQVDPVRQHEVSAGVFSVVAAGVAEYQAFVTIPEAVREDGRWYLIARLDPADAIPESDETDNVPTDATKVAIDIGRTNTDLADIVLESATVDQDAVILYPEGATRPPVNGLRDQQDHDFGATLEITTTGSRMLTNVDFSGTIVVPGAGSYALRLWDADQGSHVNRVFTTVTPGIPNTVHLEAFISGTARREIEGVLRANGSNVFRVDFHCNRSAGFGQWENGVHRHDERTNGDDNISVDVVIVLPPIASNPCNELRWGAGYKKDWSSKVFSVGVDFGTNASLDERGARAEAAARVPVKLFSLAADAASLRAFGSVLPRANAPTQSQFDLAFDVFGVSVYSTGSTNPSYTYDNSRSLVKSHEQRSVVFAGPIPIQLRAIATGTLGYRVHGLLDPARMELTATALADLSALAEATVDLAVVSAGVAGTVTLVHDEFTATASCALGVPSGGRLQGTLDFAVTNDLTGPVGRLYLFEEHPEIKWCWKVVPCGARTVRNEKTLVRFETFRKHDVLFHKTQTSSVCL